MKNPHQRFFSLSSVKKQIFCFSLFVLLICSFFSKKLTAQCASRASDSLELVSFYNNFNGGSWTYAGATASNGHVVANYGTVWDFNTPIDTWHGVVMIGGTCVSRLALPNCNVDGSMYEPNLPALLGLYLESNNISGGCPDFGGLSSLTRLLIQNNSLDGSIPDFPLPNLINLRIDGNSFTGSIPDFSGFSSIEKIQIQNCNLTGTIPDFCCLPASIFVMRLNDNNLEGCFPTSFDICALSTFDATGNPLLPWEGDHTNFCAGDSQFGAPCDGSNVIFPNCSCAPCDISSSTPSNVQCDDNGTPFDPSDDFITFDLSPTSAFNDYDLTGDPVSPTSGSFNATTSFASPLGTASGGDLNITIQDDGFGSCSVSETVTDPGTCSNACNITTSGLTNIVCDDNGTPSDPSDDFFTFELDPQAANPGSGYTITGATVTPSGENYGNSTTFSTASGTAGAGDLNITIEDNDDPTCTFAETVTDPGTCSNACNITASGLINIVCNDNGTPSDPSDDFFTFELDPQAANPGSGYTITGATVTPSGGNYGSTTTFSTSSGTAGGGDLNITIEDNDDPACTFAETVTDPGTCSGACNISASGLTNIVCDDNDTPSDPSDDFFTFELDPQAANPGSGYTITGATVHTFGGKLREFDHFFDVKWNSRRG